MKNTLVTVLDPDPLRREAISELLRPLVKYVVLHDRLDRLLANWPLTGMLAVADCGSLVADLQAAMRTNRLWRAHIVFAEAPAAHAIVDAVDGGATDYLAWPCAVHEVADRMTAWGPRSAAIRRRAELKKRAQRRLEKLTSRELQILKLVAEGMTSPEIALALRLSTKTVDVHRYNLLKKLELKSLTNAIRLVFEAQC